MSIPNRSRFAGTGLESTTRSWCSSAKYMVGFLTFDLGTSMWTGNPVTEEIAIRFPISFQIAIMATFTSIIIAVPLGVISAARQNTITDYLVRAFSIAGIALPSFWLGIMIILGLLIFTQAWNGVPWMPPIYYKSIFDDPAHNLSQLIWPALATGYRYSAVATRMTRSAMLEVLREDYVRTARAKGLVERIIVNKHALKNAMLPVVTIIGIEFAFLMGGLVVTEQVFNLNGLGKLFVESVTQADYTLTQALVMLVVFIFVLVNFIVDLMYAWLDPRIRYSVKVFAMVSSELPAGADTLPRRKTLWGAALRMTIRQPLGSAGLVVIVVMVLAALFADFVSPYDPELENFEFMLIAPGGYDDVNEKTFVLGTDQFGRDLFSRIVHGARTALFVGFTASIIGAFAGLVLGVGSAYFGGYVDLIFQRVMDVFMAFRSSSWRLRSSRFSAPALTRSS